MNRFSFLALSGLVLSFALSAAVFGRGGESSTGGGNGVAFEFKAFAKLALTSLLAEGPVEVGDEIVDVKKMLAALDSVRIESTKEPLMLNGQVKFALNFPDRKLIKVNQTEWARLSYEGKVGLALHELWGLSFHDGRDESYKYSGAMLSLLNQTDFTKPSEIYEASVGAEMMGREILKRNLLQGPGAKNAVQGITYWLEGSREGIDVFLAKFTCQRSLSKDYCDLDLKSRKLARTFKIQVTLYQGTVSTADVRRD